MTAQRIRMQGFIVFDYMAEYGAAGAQLARWLAEEKIKRSETIIRGGLAKAPQALVDLYRGINTGECSPLVSVSSVDSEK